MQCEEGIRLTDKLIIFQIYIPNIRRKWYNEGIEKLTKAEKYALVLVEPNIQKSKELGRDDKIMEDFIKEAKEVEYDDYLFESYDKELALKDEYKKEGKEEGKKVKKK